MKSCVACACLVLAISARAVAETADTIVLDICDGRPVVSGVFLNGHGPYRFLLDTGSTLNHVDPKIAKSIGMIASFETQLTASSGRVAAAGSDGSEVRLGSVRADRQVFLFAGIEALHAISPDIQGVLGEVFLSRFDYLIDLRGKRLTFGAHMLGEKHPRLPFRTIGGRPVVTTSLGSLVLDSGAHYVTRFGVHASENTHELITASGSIQVGTVYSTLIIAQHTFWRGDAVALPRSLEGDADGLLPIAPFKSVYVSNSENYVALD